MLYMLFIFFKAFISNVYSDMLECGYESMTFYVLISDTFVSFIFSIMIIENHIISITFCNPTRLQNED